MSKILFCLFFVLSLEFVLARRYSRCSFAFERCEWTFSDATYGKVDGFFLDRKSDVPFTSRIVSKNPRVTLGVVNMNGFVAEFIDESEGAIPITSLGNPRYTPTHFKPYAIPGSFGSGIGHQNFTGNQLYKAKNRCVRIRFSSYQQLFGPKPPYVKYNFNDVKADEGKCVVFTTH